MKEKFKLNKGLIIGLLIIVVAIVAIICVTIFAKPSYKKQIKEFVKACESEEKMEKYVKKYVNLRAYYAMQQSDEPKDMDEEYKKAKKEDYEDGEFVEEVLEAFKEWNNFSEIVNSEIKVEDIGKPEDIDKDSGFISIFSDVKEIKQVKCTLKAGEDKQICYALFYKGKMLMIMPDIQDTEDTKDVSATGNAQDSLLAALSSITTAYYGKVETSDAQKELNNLENISDILESDDFKTELEDLMPDYDIEEAGSVVKFSEKADDGYMYEAKLNENSLTVESFENKGKK